MKIAWLLLCLFVLPALASAKISLEIKGAVDSKSKNLTVDYYGSQVDIISDTERNTFKMSDERLKMGAQIVWGRPDDIYIKSPTPWGDLYKTYGWKQVQRTLEPIEAKVLGVSSQLAILRTQVFENNSTKTGIYTVGITQEVENTVSSTWTFGGELTVGSEISYELDFEIGKVGSKMSLSYTSSWGRDASKSESVKLGTTSSVQIELKPGESVTAVLQATKGSLQVEIEYEAMLSGKAACNFNREYFGHHFWDLNIKSVMKKAGLSYTTYSREVISVGFFSDGKIVVYDKDSGDVVLQNTLN